MKIHNLQQLVRTNAYQLYPFYEEKLIYCILGFLAGAVGKGMKTNSKVSQQFIAKIFYIRNWCGTVEKNSGNISRIYLFENSS